MLLPLKGSAWGYNDEVTSVHFNILEDEIANAFDAINGGAYTLVAPASIGGQFLTISNLICDVETFLSGTTHIAVADVEVVLTIDGTSSAEIDFTAGATLRGAAGTFIVWDGLVTFNNDVTCNDPLICNDNFQHLAGIAIFASTLNIGGTTQFTAGSFRIQAGVVTSIEAPLVLGTGGFIQHNPVTGQDAANIHYDIAVDGDVIVWTSVTADRDVFIENAPAGAKMLLALDPTGSFTPGTRLAIRRADTTLINWLTPVGGGAGTYSAFDLFSVGGVWKHIHPSINGA